jgi:glycerol uptake facilitator-like aquaporin
MLGYEISIIVLGALISTVVFLFGGSLLLLGITILLRSAGIQFVLFPFAWWLIISFVFGPILGGLVGYLIYKKSKYAKITYYDPFA